MKTYNKLKFYLIVFLPIILILTISNLLYVFFQTNHHLNTNFEIFHYHQTRKSLLYNENHLLINNNDNDKEEKEKNIHLNNENLNLNVKSTKSTKSNNNNIKIIKQEKNILCGIGWKENPNFDINLSNNNINQSLLDNINNLPCIRQVNNPSVIDHTFIDLNILPCDNFYEFSCGRFDKDPLNIQQGIDATFDYLELRTQQTLDDVTQIILNHFAPSDSLVSAFYHTCTNHNDEHDFHESIIIQQLLSTIDHSILSYNDLAKTWGILQLFNINLPLKLIFESNPFPSSLTSPLLNKNDDDNKKKIPLIMQGGLFIDPSLISSQEHYNDILSRLSLIYSSKEQAEMWTKQIIDIEVLLRNEMVNNPAKDIIEYLEYYNGRDDFIIFDKEFISKFTNDFDLLGFIENACPFDSSNECLEKWIPSFENNLLWCYSKQYLSKLTNILTKFSLKSWIVYTKHAILFQLDDSLNFYHSSNNQYILPWKRNLLLSSSTSTITNNNNLNDKEKEKICLNIVQQYLPHIIDQYYINGYFSSNIQKLGIEIANNIKFTYLNYLNSSLININSSSTSSSTISNNLILKNIILKLYDKLDSVQFNIGIPFNWPNVNYQSLTINIESYSDNIITIHHYYILQNYFFNFIHHQQQYNNLNISSISSLSSIDLDNDKENEILLILSSSSITNLIASNYQHQINTIMIGAGIMQPPLFSTEFDLISLYSRFGFLIAHELSHSIDTVGILFDNDGKYHPWLTNNELGVYRKQLECLINLYSIESPLGNQHNGFVTLNENFADILGFQISYQTFVDVYYKQYNILPSIDTQRNFFISYAQMFCNPLLSSSKIIEQEFIKSSVHSINSFRVNFVVSQINNFNHLWNCQSSSFSSSSSSSSLYENQQQQQSLLLQKKIIAKSLSPSSFSSSSSSNLNFNNNNKKCLIF